MDETLKMLKELTDARAISGNERESRKVMKSYIETYADEVMMDGLGSLVAKKIGDANGPKVMIAGHLDELGFMVTKISDKGFIYFQPIGGWLTHVMPAQRVTVMTSKGDIVGIIGSKPPHIVSADARKKAPDMTEMFVDIGASSREEAIEWGVRQGDSIVPDFPFTVMKNEKMLMAKAWDNRIGCAVAIGVLKQLQTENHPNIVYGVGTVQEEVGLRGAKTSAHLIQPDIAFALDVAIPVDTPNVTDKEALAHLGAGPHIMLYDSLLVSHKELREFVISVAEELNIPYGFDIMPGGSTDGGSIHLTGSGVPTITLTVPVRYIHSHASIIHRDDYENTVKLLVEVIKRLDIEKVKGITYN